MTENATDGIVVGVDGSEASVAALRWAGEQARALATRVTAVHAWEPATALFAPYAPVSGRPTVEEQRERAAEVLAAAVRTAFGAHRGTGVHAIVAEGRPARVLLRHTRGALLLALGRKAGGPMEPPGIGAVARECLRHATVPVVTVPALVSGSTAPSRPVDIHGTVQRGAA
ncbi:universal stress protein [Streptomyces sp. NPDC023723]|uniref:universal stress protein n=1 Tax=Streptomyces sp. NPDC023723 TaxID=3154323 RepID=UPI0033CDA467